MLSMLARALFCSSVSLLMCGCAWEGAAMLQAERIGARSDVPAPRGRYDAHMDVCGDPIAYGFESDLVRAPYLQKVSASSAEVLWTSGARTGRIVDVTLPGGERVASVASRIEAPATARGPVQHVAELSGLAPNTLYCYALRTHPRRTPARAALRTAPAPGSGTPIAFVAFGDSGDGGSDQRAVFDSIRRVRFDLVLVTGDVAYPSGSLASLERYFFAVYEPMLARVPAFPVAGNHDYETLDAAPFREVFSLPENGAPAGRERWYSFDWGDVHFVALDTQHIGQAQAAWLHADLSRNDLPWTVVFTHKSPYASGHNGSSKEFRALFSPILEAHGVPLVLAGHDHSYERTRAIGGVTYVVTGGGGRNVLPVGASGFTAFSLAVLHFVYVTIDGADLRLYAIDATGQEFDFVRITRPARR